MVNALGDNSPMTDLSPNLLKITDKKKGDCSPKISTDNKYLFFFIPLNKMEFLKSQREKILLIVENFIYT